MYVCLCKGITDHQIRAAAEQGCQSLHDLRRELGVASQCAKCARDARDVLRECDMAAPAAGEPLIPGIFTPQPA